MNRTTTRGPFLTVALVVMAFAATSVFAGSAAASGPAPPGKEIIKINCEGTPLTVSVARNEHGKGAGQIVGAKGHGIPVNFAITVNDLTTGVNGVFHETETKGNGNAHHNQATTNCSLPIFEGEAAEVFGTELPEGVAGADIVEVVEEVNVVLKP